MTPKQISIPFLLIIFGLPLGQAGWELVRRERVQFLDVFGPIEEERLRAFDDELRDDSWIFQQFVPAYQRFLLEFFGNGNLKIVAGRDGWLYYADDLSLVMGPGFLPRHQRRPWSQVDAIADFREQVVAEGAELLLVPIPAKGMFDAAALPANGTGPRYAENPDTQAFFSGLDEREVPYVDVIGLFRELQTASGGAQLFMPRDSHWTPATMRRVADVTAIEARTILGEAAADLLDTRSFEAVPETIAAEGDLVGLLRLPTEGEVFEPMQLELGKVKDATSGAPFASDRNAPILLLGDSFTRVFSDERLGVGTEAGFAESLALELGANLDLIAIPGGSARGVRESVARRQDGLAGKRLVIWQISMRDLAAGADKWERVLLRDGDVDPDQPAEETLEVRAQLEAISVVPEGFEYEFALVVYRYSVLEVLTGAARSGPLHVVHVAKDNFEDAPAVGLEVGGRLLLTLEDVNRHHDLEQVYLQDDTESFGHDLWFATSFERE